MRTLIFLVSVFFVNACQFSQSIDKDLKTGAVSRGDGLACEGVYIQIDDKNVNRNEFVFGENIHLLFSSVTGFKSTDSKVYPKLSMSIIQNDLDTVYYEPNLLHEFKDGFKETTLDLYADFSANLPHVNQEKYKVSVKIWDEPGNHTFTYELPFTIKQNDLLKVDSNGIKYTEIYLWDAALSRYVVHNKISRNQNIMLVLEGIQGLEAISDKVFPVFSIELADKHGEILLSNPNLLSDYETVGVDPEVLRSRLAAEISDIEGAFSNPLFLTVQVKDANSVKQLTVKTELTVE